MPTLSFPGFPPIEVDGPVITEIPAYPKCEIMADNWGCPCDMPVRYLVGKTLCCTEHIHLAISFEVQHTDDGKVTVEYR